MTTKQLIKEYVDDHFKHFGFYPYDVEVDDMINKELYIREHRRPIGQSDLIINEWLLKKS